MTYWTSAQRVEKNVCFFHRKRKWKKSVIDVGVASPSHCACSLCFHSHPYTASNPYPTGREDSIRQTVDTKTPRQHFYILFKFYSSYFSYTLHLIFLTHQSSVLHILLMQQMFLHKAEVYVTVFWSFPSLPSCFMSL